MASQGASWDFAARGDSETLRTTMVSRRQAALDNAPSFSAPLASGPGRWTQQFGTSSGERGNAIAVGASDGVYVTGYTSGSLAGTNAGSSDGYVRKYGSAGMHQWTEQFGTQTSDAGHGIALDASENLHISGDTRGSLGGTAAGLNDGFVLQIPGG
jgi:hypothetical protein